jgi:hypothetical protein
MSYIIQVRIQYERPRYLAWDKQGGWHTTRLSEAMTFVTEDEGSEIAKDKSVKDYFKACHLTVVPLRMWRKITTRDRHLEEKSSIRGRMFSWRAIPVTTLTLECGHTKVVRGDNVPKHKALCKKCEEGVTDGQARTRSDHRPTLGNP